jgi:hypothetical protein
MHKQQTRTQCTTRRNINAQTAEPSSAYLQVAVAAGTEARHGLDGQAEAAERLVAGDAARRTPATTRASALRVCTCRKSSTA